MKNEEYITIAEFSKLVGKSKQAIYSNKTLKKYSKVVQGKKVIDKRALKDVYGIELEEPCNTTESNALDKLKALQVQYNKLYKELEQLRQYKADREELDKKILVALERFKHEKEVTKMLKEQKKRDDQIIDDLMQRNKKQTELLEQANVLKLLEIRK